MIMMILDGVFATIGYTDKDTISPKQLLYRYKAHPTSPKYLPQLPFTFPPLTMFKFAVLLTLSAVAVWGVPPPGSYVPVPVDDEGVVRASHEGARALSEKLDSKFHHRLIKVVQAEQQVVAGFNFRMDVIVGETNCVKDEVEYDDVEDCEFRNRIGAYKKCGIVVYEDLNGNHHLTRSTCMLISEKDI